MFCPFLENREEEKMINKLVAKIKETKAPIVVGLDRESRRSKRQWITVNPKIWW